MNCDFKGAKVISFQLGSTELKNGQMKNVDVDKNRKKDNEIFKMLRGEKEKRVPLWGWCLPILLSKGVDCLSPKQHAHSCDPAELTGD